MPKLLCIISLICPLFFFGQITIDAQETTMDLAVVARNSNNKGFVRFKAEVDKSGSEPDYDKIEIKIFKTSNLLNDTSDLGSETAINEFEVALDYAGNIANPDLSLQIDAELSNYSFEFNFIEDNPAASSKYYILNVVAGDVFIINGQSNAVARNREGSTASMDDNQSDFIRTVGSTERDDIALTDPALNVWSLANTGISFNDAEQAGFVGEWGLKLGKLIVDGQNIPVAIFNGARGAKGIAWHQVNHNDPDNNSNVYERLLHRLTLVNLENEVKAIFWSQGENDWERPKSFYIDEFETLRTSWRNDYNENLRIYILQTKSGCIVEGAPNIGDAADIWVKESQRELARNYSDISLVSTSGLTYYLGDENKCHFTYNNGYEQFALRLYELLEIDFYGEPDLQNRRTPIPTDAAMVDDETLVISTTSNSLEKSNTPIDLNDFILEDAGGSVIESIEVQDGEILLTLDQPPTSGAKISYQGLGAGENDDKFVTQSNGLEIEIACFKGFPIMDAGDYAVWDNASWANGISPDINKHVYIRDYYDVEADLDAFDLTIRSGNDLDFDFDSRHTITVSDKLTIEGNLTIGDTESLIVQSSSSNAISIGNSGSFKKIENSTSKTGQYDVTYWSSPIETASFSGIFDDVDPARIFELDPDYVNTLYNSGIYEKYKHWKNPDGANMIPGLGYSSDGPSTGSYPMSQSLVFEGKPNNGTISVPIKTDGSDGGSETGFDANLLGNPYPSAIDADEFIDANDSRISGAIYLWSHRTDISGGEFDEDDYVTYNEGGPSSPVGFDGFIASGQGFMVIASQDGSVNFNNSMRVGGENDQFFKNESSKNRIAGEKKEKERDRVWLKLKNEQGSVKSIMLGFFPEATGEVDRGYDALSLSASSMNFYSVLKGEKYSIQGLSTFESNRSARRNREIVLGMDTDKTGKYSISISRLEGALQGVPIMLKDRYTGQMHNLKRGSYEFEVENPGEAKNRFVLVFRSNRLSPKIESLDSTLKISQTRSDLRLNCSEKMNRITIFGLFGKKLYEISPKSEEYQLKLNFIKPGSLIYIQILTENGQQFVRKVIKY
jgi:hypothetical protein